MLKRQLKVSRKKSFFLFGPRQVGKSTFIKSNFNDNVLIYDLLKYSEYIKLVENPSILEQELKAKDPCIKYIIIDEIQKIPALLDEVHRILESPNPPIFILSGSSARKLKRDLANMLGGRALTYNLFPLTHLELGSAFDLDKVLNIGSLPAVYLAEEDEEKILKSYVETYLEEEIQAEALVRNIGSFSKFLRLAADENGNIINFSNIARNTATDRKLVKEYFQILEDTLIGFFLLPFDKACRKKLAKHPKFYFFDIGVQRAIAKQIFLRLESGTSLYGKAFEHFIILELYRLNQYLDKDYEFSFYRTNDNAEVDLIIQTPQKDTYAIEIKSGTNIDGRAFRGLKSFQELVPSAQLLCVSLVERRRLVGEVVILPWQEVFEVLGLVTRVDTV